MKATFFGFFALLALGATSAFGQYVDGVDELFERDTLDFEARDIDNEYEARSIYSDAGVALAYRALRDVHKMALEHTAQVKRALEDFDIYVRELESRGGGVAFESKNKIIKPPPGVPKAEDIGVKLQRCKKDCDKAHKKKSSDWDQCYIACARRYRRKDIE